MKLTSQLFQGSALCKERWPLMTNRPKIAWGHKRINNDDLFVGVKEKNTIMFVHLVFDHFEGAASSGQTQGVRNLTKDQGRA